MDRKDVCPNCGNMPYYDGHEKLCLQEKIDELEERILALEKVTIVQDKWGISHTMEFRNG